MLGCASAPVQGGASGLFAAWEEVHSSACGAGAEAGAGEVGAARRCVEAYVCSRLSAVGARWRACVAVEQGRARQHRRRVLQLD